MEAFILLMLIFLLLFIVLFAFVTIENKRRDEEVSSSLNTFSESLKKEVIEIISPVKERLDSTKQSLGETISDLKEETKRTVEELGNARVTLERLSSENRRVQEITEKLGDLFRSTKERGTIGEFLLENILSSFLPDYMWERQFSIGSETERVDAVVKFKNMVVPIDSKFPRESYLNFANSQGEESKRKWKDFKNAIKNKIKDISEKYIRPGEGTSNYAIMFVPSEPVHSIISSSNDPFGERNDIWDFAVSKRVILAGPYSLLAIISSLLAFNEAETIGKKINLIYRAINGALERMESIEKVMTIAKKQLKSSLENISRVENEIEKAKYSLNIAKQEEKVLPDNQTPSE